MGKKAPSQTPITQLAVRNPPIGGTLSIPDGYWIDTKYFFVKKSPTVDQKFYYRSLRSCYECRQAAGGPEFYDRSEFDTMFSGCAVGRAPYALKEKFANLPHAEMDKIIRATFHLDPEISWRWPRPGREFITGVMMVM